MSLPVAAEFVQISLILFMTSLLSPLGAGNMIFNTTTVCTTKSGNNTHISYNVSGYNETKLVLSCTGEAGRTLLWTRVDGRVLCASRNCTINSDRRLTNDDSGDYVCKVSVANGTEFQFIHINVLAPPKLTTKLTECHGDNNDKCTIRQNTDFFMWSTYNITVSYDGNGPFHVEWYHNSTKFMCSDFKFCQMENGTTYQKLQLQSTSLTEAETMPGLYSAIVSNSYGTNESMIRIQRSCVPKGLPHPKPEIVVDLQEGSTLNDSCSIEIQPGSLMYACITKNLSATFDDLKDDLGYGGCSVCNGANDFGHQCTCQFNSSITDITVSRSDDGGCPAKQIMNFMKNDVTVEDDNGTKIICAYTTIDEVIPYTSIYVKVSRPPNNHSSQVRATVSSTVVCFIVVLGILALAIVSYVVLRKKKRQHSGVRDGFIQASGPPDPERPDSDYAEHQPLLNTRQGDVDLYGSVIEDFPGVLGSDEPSENVTIHASNQ